MNQQYCPACGARMTKQDVSAAVCPRCRSDVLAPTTRPRKVARDERVKFQKDERVKRPL